MKPASISVCGNLTLDELTQSSIQKIVPGGTAMFAGVAAAFLGASVGIIGNVGGDYPGSVLKRLSSYGLDLSRLRKSRRPSTRFKITHSSGTRKLFLLERGRSVLNGSTARKMDGMHLGPVYGEISDRFARNMRRSVRFMSADLQGFVRNVTRNGTVFVQRRNLGALLNTCDMVQASMEEAKPLAGSGDSDEVLDWLLAAGPKYSILTLGSKGSLIGIRPDQRYWVPAFKEGKAVDTTGAGDIFAGSWLSTFLATEDPIWASSVGSAFASLSSRKTGLSKFQLSRNELFRRAGWVYNHVRAVQG